MVDSGREGRRVTDKGAPHVMETKRQIYTDLHRDVAQSVRDSEKLIDYMMKQNDYREGVTAFLEKRSPKWSGD